MTQPLSEGFPVVERRPLDLTETLLLASWKMLETRCTDATLAEIKKYSRIYARYALYRAAQSLDLDSQFSAARVVRDKADTIS